MVVVDQAKPKEPLLVRGLLTAAQFRGRQCFQRNTRPNNMAPGLERSVSLVGSLPLCSLLRRTVPVCHLGSGAPNRTKADRFRDSVAKKH